MGEDFWNKGLVPPVPRRELPKGCEGGGARGVVLAGSPKRSFVGRGGVSATEDPRLEE